MSELKLISPSQDYENEILGYKTEFLEYGDTLHGSAGLEYFERIGDWFRALEKNSKEETVTKGLVPASTYLAIRIRDGRLIGMIDIRHRLSETLKRFGGHIGYGVRPSERGQGYARTMLCLALDKCVQMNIFNVSVACHKDNHPSQKTILACGGRFVDEVLHEDRLMLRHYISLFKIRRVIDSDFAVLTNYWNAMTDFDNWYTPLDIRDFSLLLLQAPGFLAEAEGRILGSILCGYNGVTGLIYNFAVDHRCRDQGIGGILKQAALDGFSALGLKKAAFLSGATALEQ